MEKPFQFNLRAALLFIAAVAVLLGVGSVVPRLLLVAIAVFAILGGSTFVFSVLRWGDRALQYDSPRPLALGSMMLTSVSVLIAILVMLPLPGGRGPVQLWVDSSIAMFVFNLRLAALLIMPISPILCGLIGKVRLDSGMPPRFGWLTAATVSYVVAWYVIGTQAFFPLV